MTCAFVLAPPGAAATCSPLSFGARRLTVAAASGTEASVDIVKAALDLRRKNKRRAWPPRQLALALQGGGSFGAFTWGALDRLLEEKTIAFDAFSGASAGAVNAVLLASGL